jgi:hypothetical protein
MDFYLIFNITIYFALTVSLAIFVISIFKKRFSRNILFRILSFLIFVAISKAVTLFLINSADLMKYPGNFLVIAFLIMSITIAFIKNSFYLIKNETENIW